MASKIDPHHLVLIIHATYGTRRQDGAPRRSGAMILENGIGGEDDDNENIQTCRILDAFSSLSVHKPKAQVFAFGLQSDSAKEEITLTVAENKNIQAGLERYLQEIWGGLRKLSNMYTSTGAGRSEEDGRSAEVPSGVGLPFKIEIYRTISRFTLAKQMKRADILIPPLLQFMNEVIGYRGHSYPQDFDLNLYSLVQGMNEIACFYRDIQTGGNPTGEEWELVFRKGMAVSDEAAIVLTAGDHLGCETLAEEVNSSKDDPEEYPFRLRRTIEKLISQSDHIENLFEFAISSSLRSALKSELIISTIPHQSCPVRLPKSSEAWEAILNAENFGNPEDRNEVAEKLAAFNTQTCVIHCECKIVQHFRTPGNDIPLFNYLAVSKLSCGACRVWFKAFNELGKQKFYTRGSHGAWYWPWGMSKVEPALPDAMVTKLRSVYIEHQSLDAQTESTIASPIQERLPRLTFQERQSILSKWVAQKKQKYIGYDMGPLNDFARFFKQGLESFLQ